MCLKNNNVTWTIIGIIVFIILLIFVLTLLVSCGNKMLIDTRYTYNMAYITIGDETIKVEIDSWRDYSDGDQIQVVAKDGKVYLSNSTNIGLVKE